ncbi:hypothetical protein CAOG_02712 [Capsaspora owczarzaki ATCC 30864]|uniref:BZIP domain-containing protein n=1 Tax=Capsaspora owczarzaki (strain ATCC 30864) TaxID=595528 RepID=A0A0D2X1Y0_CAPO3|nr:hypothetical protein CAOG_02712 [Capsaspora owczarzaki ATCC 30864]KJE91594.1 hypothetical protein CAOG_002712 [Capsaspora owczarzaki ATCC 30864]|eukprot:XP_004349462.1 hypothetical protein CAOG_02712 [Capsaspora owczarzaki ATCC 30864]
MEEDAPAGSDDSSDAEEDGNFEGSDSEDMDVSDPEYNGTAATSATKTTPKGRARKVAGSGAAAKLAATSSASTRQRKLSQSSDSSDVPAQASGSIDKRSLKRLRNREAAARCRNRRRQLIDELSTQVAELVAEKTTMAATIARLEAELATTRGN